MLDIKKKIPAEMTELTQEEVDYYVEQHIRAAAKKVDVKYSRPWRMSPEAREKFRRMQRLWYDYQNGVKMQTYRGKDGKVLPTQPLPKRRQFAYKEEAMKKLVAGCTWTGEGKCPGEEEEEMLVESILEIAFSSGLNAINEEAVRNLAHKLASCDNCPFLQKASALGWPGSSWTDTHSDAEVLEWDDESEMSMLDGQNITDIEYEAFKATKDRFREEVIEEITYVAEEPKEIYVGSPSGPVRLKVAELEPMRQSGYTNCLIGELVGRDDSDEEDSEVVVFSLEELEETEGEEEEE